jgi:CDP-glucose 4,6-dehydratase
MDLKIWKDKRVLVTGHTGFKGAWLTCTLEALGAKVSGFSLPPQLAPNLYRDAKIFKLLEGEILGDIRDYKLVEKVFKQFQPDYVFHLAAQSLVIESYLKPLETISTNILGSANIIDVALRSGQVSGLLNITTDKVYENNQSGKFHKETDLLGGDDIYSASKASSELITRAMKVAVAKEGFHLHSARAGNVIGGGDWSVNRLIPDAIRAIQSKKSLVIRNSLATRPWQHVLDCLNGYILIAENALTPTPKPLNLAYNFGPPESLSVMEVLTLLLKELGLKLEIQEEIPQYLEKSSLNLDATLARGDLGWKARMTSEESVLTTAKWYKSFLDGKDANYLVTEEIYSFLSGGK